MNFTNRILTLAVVSLVSFYSLQAQVTIGSDLAPVKGAILDMKQHTPDANNVTSSKGLLLPRVALTDMESLNNIPDADSSNPLKYTGLMVYNTEETNNGCLVIPKGLYVWNSEKWEGVGVKVEGVTMPGSYRDDLILMKKIKDANPNAGIQYNIDLNDPTKNDPDNKIQTSEYAFKQVCGQKRLWSLYFYNMPNLTVIDVKGAMSLNALSLYKTGVSKLDVSGNKIITFLDVSDSPIKELDLSNNPNLNRLNANYTQIKSLDFSHNKKLEILNVSDSPIETMDLSKHTELIEVKAINTKISVLDISKSINLRTVELAPANKNSTISKVIINQKTIDKLKSNDPYGPLRPMYPNPVYEVVND